MERSSQSAFAASDNMAVATAAGVLNVFVTSPLWTATTIITCKKDSSSKEGLFAVLTRLFKEEGLHGLYRGLIPALILVSNPAIQHTLYEQVVRRIRGATGRALSPLEIFIVGALSKLLATLITYPYQTIKARQQARARAAGSSTVPSTKITDIIRKEGVHALYAGLSAKLMFTVLNSALMFLCYDSILNLFRSRS